MSSIAFTKVHGCQNDFVLVDAWRGLPPDPSAFATSVCPRRSSVGADGVLVVDRPGELPRMRLFNADGGEAEMCGNGVRCVAAWLVRAGHAPAGPVSITTAAGVVACALEPDGSIVAEMPEPRFVAPNLPVTSRPPAWVGRAPESGPTAATGFDRGIAVSLGNPHLVVPFEGPGALADAPLLALADAVDRSRTFSEGVNVELVQVVAPAELRVRVRERGVGETLACGTGACAAAAALVSPPFDVLVHLSGGTLEIRWQGPGHAIHLRGPVEIVYDGLVETIG